MKISFKPLLLVIPSLLVMACGQAKKPADAPTTSDQPAASSASPTPAEAAAGGDTQGPGPRGGGGGDRLQRMAATLELTPDQTEKMKALFEAQRPAIEAIRNDQSLSREQRREKMMELRKANEPQVEAILTPEQQAKWKENREKMRAQMGNRGGGKEGTDQPSASPAN